MKKPSPDEMEPIPLLGYANKLSGCPGDTLEFKISSTSKEPIHAHLVRVICADPNPAGMGLVEEKVPVAFGGTFPSVERPFFPGSCASIAVDGVFQSSPSFTLVANLWPTAPERGVQGIISCQDSRTESFFHVCLDAHGFAMATLSTPHQTFTITTGEKFKIRKWARIWASYDANTQTLSVGQHELTPPFKKATTTQVLDAAVDLRAMDQMFIAALQGTPANHHFNGKIEAPMVFDRVLSEEEILNLSRQIPGGLQAHWDFSKGISTTKIEDVGPHQKHGDLFNMPARAMTGSNWTGEEMCWRHAPQHYGAIHFHEDDIYDFGWQTDFSFTIPENLKSGVYAARLRCGKHEEAIPFFVCPSPGKPTARLCVLVSTFTYTVYGNMARPDFQPSWLERNQEWNAYPWNPAVYPQYGLSTYNFHTDGSGICHASHKRPLFTLKPGYLTFGASEGQCSGLRHFQADSHLIAWLEQQGIAYDLITDRELHDKGWAAIKDYAALTTGSHPEYHTSETLNALHQYREQGGHLIYLGGNGFYWRVALHPEDPDMIEIRRAEGGIRAWAAEPGEYYQAFDGAYGGLWRRNNRPPQQLAAVGFSAQGTFLGSYYKVHPEARSHSETSWIFAGIEEEKLGDFGYSGNGAAGFELDRADPRLGTPENTHVLASSEGHGEDFVLVPEELLTHITTWAGEPIEDLIRADMVYQKSESGSQLFAAGSITFCGSLLHNKGKNNISQLLANVLHGFLKSS